LEAEADDGSVEIARLAEVFLSPVISGTRGVVIHGALEDKEDDAMMVASSTKGATPGTGSSDSKSMAE